MRASLRWNLILSAGLLVVSQKAIAQTVPDAASNTPATDAIGPRELQDFSLPGTAAKPTDQPPTAPVAQPGPANKSAQASDQQAQQPATRATLRRPTKVADSAPPVAKLTPPAQSGLSRSSEALRAATASVAPMPTMETRPAAPAPRPNGSASMAPERPLSMLPWLLAALALAAGSTFIFWRRKQLKEGFAGSSNYDRLIPPDPVPAAPPAPRAPMPPPQPPAAPPPAAPQAAVPRGIVASRLRPSLELGVQPLSCLVDDEQVTIEFEVELFNSGTAPARAVIAEASLLNASASQDQELAAFYAKAPADGDRIDSIPPMARMTFKNRVVAPRAAVQEYELAGRKSFVPVLAFNAQYEWSGGKAQSSLAFLLGRETRGEKLGPLHLDGVQREVRRLGARVLPTAVRT